MIKTATEKILRELEAAATNMDMMARGEPGRTRLEIPPVNPCPKDRGRDDGDRLTTAPPEWISEFDRQMKEIFDRWRPGGGGKPVKVEHVPRTTADETAPSKAAELRRAAAAEKKGMQEQFREWFEGGRGARARGRGGAGRRSGGRR